MNFNELHRIKQASSTFDVALDIELYLYSSCGITLLTYSGVFQLVTCLVTGYNVLAKLPSIARVDL